MATENDNKIIYLGLFIHYARQKKRSFYYTMLGITKSKESKDFIWHKQTCSLS